MNFCPNCGTKNGGFDFCSNCGFNISTLNVDFKIGKDETNDVIWNKFKLEKNDFDVFLKHGTGSDIFDDEIIELPIEILNFQNKLFISVNEYDLIRNTVTGNKGLLELDEYVYIGNILDNKRNGVGTLLYFDENEKKYAIHYHGEWVNDKKNGFGIEVNIFYQTPTYIGNWVNNEYHGEGIKFSTNLGKYVGKFSSGYEDGIGIKYHENGLKSYEGSWVKGKEHGSGISYNIFGDILHNGFHDSSNDNEDDDECYSEFNLKDGAGIR